MKKTFIVLAILAIFTVTLTGVKAAAPTPHNLQPQSVPPIVLVNGTSAVLAKTGDLIIVTGSGFNVNDTSCNWASVAANMGTATPCVLSGGILNFNFRIAAVAPSTYTLTVLDNHANSGYAQVIVTTTVTSSTLTSSSTTTTVTTSTSSTTSTSLTSTSTTSTTTSSSTSTSTVSTTTRTSTSNFTATSTTTKYSTTSSSSVTVTVTATSTSSSISVFLTTSADTAQTVILSTSTQLNIADNPVYPTAVLEAVGIGVPTIIVLIARAFMNKPKPPPVIERLPVNPPEPRPEQ